MAYQRGSKTNLTSVRLTGLFATRRQGLAVGTISVDDIKNNLGPLLKKAITEGKGVTLFLWKQAYKTQEEAEGKPTFALSADLSRDQADAPQRSYPQRSTSRRPIEPDDDPFEGTPARTSKPAAGDDFPFS